MVEWCRSMTPYRNSDSWNITCNVWNCTNVISMQLKLYLYSMAQHMTWWQKKYINGNDQPWEGIKCAEEKQQTRPRLKSYADVTLCALCQARLVLANSVPPQTSCICCHLANTQQLLVPHSLFSCISLLVYLPHNVPAFTYSRAHTNTVYNPYSL